MCLPLSERACETLAELAVRVERLEEKKKLIAADLEDVNTRWSAVVAELTRTKDAYNVLAVFVDFIRQQQGSEPCTVANHPPT